MVIMTRQTTWQRSDNMKDSVTAAKAPWAIVTSATRPLVTGWFDVLKLPPPANLITAEDVPNGKPDPACYKLGLKALRLLGEDGNISAKHDVLVLEDSPAGIRAGKAAGCKVVAVVTSHTAQQVVDAGADWIVKDLTSLQLLNNDNGSVEISIKDALIVA